MKIFKNKQNLQKQILKDKYISFIPTMGGLHKGHVSLIEKSKNYKYKILVSIFVNSKQFNKKKDYQKYPRNIMRDIKILKELKVQYLYLPTYKDIYNFKCNNKIFIDKFSKQLCGKFRKGHFLGVLDVVNRFLEIIKPKYIYLGLKDFQQLILIDKHILKNKIKTKVIRCKTIREPNGIPFSTRNFNLSRNQLNKASNIFRYLYNLKRQMKKKIKLFKFNSIKNDLINLGADKIDYIENIDIKNLKHTKKFKKNIKIFIAYYINKVRLIDNI